MSNNHHSLSKIYKILEDIKKEANKQLSTDDLSKQLSAESKKMYSYYSLEMCLNKLSGKNTDACRDGLLRTKKIFERINK